MVVGAAAAASERHHVMRTEPTPIDDASPRRDVTGRAVARAAVVREVISYTVFGISACVCGKAAPDAITWVSPEDLTIFVISGLSALVLPFLIRMR
jgi:hypothetical protein